MTDPNNEITVKMARIGANLTQQEVADAMGVHVQTYSQMERHPEKMSIEEAISFGRIVGRDWTTISYGSNSN